MPRPNYKLEPLWAHALLTDVRRITRDPNDTEFGFMDLTTPLTPPTLEKLFEYQGGRCALSGRQMILPIESAPITHKSGLNPWLDELSREITGRTPWLTRIDKLNPIGTGNALLICRCWREVCNSFELFDNAVAEIKNLKPLTHYPDKDTLNQMLLQEASNG